MTGAEAEIDYESKAQNILEVLEEKEETSFRRIECRKKE